jgi:hypothetical protein
LKSKPSHVVAHHADSFSALVGVGEMEIFLHDWLFHEFFPLGECYRPQSFEEEAAGSRLSLHLSILFYACLYLNYQASHFHVLNPIDEIRYPQSALSVWDLFWPLHLHESPEVVHTYPDL